MQIVRGITAVFTMEIQLSLKKGSQSFTLGEFLVKIDKTLLVCGFCMPPGKELELFFDSEPCTGIQGIRIQIPSSLIRLAECDTRRTIGYRR